jgi:hypothetical protein
MLDLISTVVAAELFQFIDKVEEKEEGHETERDKNHGPQHLRVNEFLDGFHAAACLMAMSRRQLQLL